MGAALFPVRRSFFTLTCVESGEIDATRARRRVDNRLRDAIEQTFDCCTETNGVVRPPRVVGQPEPGQLLGGRRRPDRVAQEADDRRQVPVWTIHDIDARRVHLMMT